MDPATSSLDWIERVKAGDREAFCRLFRKYERRLAVRIHFRLGPRLRERMEVDDVVQETFLQAYRDLQRFEYRGPGSFLGWLHAVAEHVVADRARHEARQKRRGEEVRFRSESNPHGPEPADSKTPSRLLAGNEELRRLLGHLDALPEQYREVILLARVEGLNTSELAARLGKTNEGASLLLHRALKRLAHLTGKP